MQKTEDDIHVISEIVALYFTATYEGNAAILTNILFEDAKIAGFINNQWVSWNVPDFVKRVTLSPTAKEKDEPFNKKIILIDKTGDIAMVKTEVLVGGSLFTDYIILIKNDGQWCIKNKFFIT